jgi:hypothetical protein
LHKVADRLRVPTRGAADTLDITTWALTGSTVVVFLQLEVRDLTRSDVCFKGRVGSTVNNALHVAQHSNGEGQQDIEQVH